MTPVSLTEDMPGVACVSGLSYVTLSIHTESSNSFNQRPPCALLIKDLCVVKLWKPQHVQVIAPTFSILPIFSLQIPIISSCQIRLDDFRVHDQIVPAQGHGNAMVADVFFPQDVVGPEEAPEQGVRDANIFGSKVGEHMLVGRGRLSANLSNLVSFRLVQLREDTLQNCMPRPGGAEERQLDQ
jgi:hypothetical protein